MIATSKRGDCVLFDGKMIHRGTPCRSALPRQAVYTVFHKKWYTDYVDNQFSKAANAHGAPRDAVIPSGFQVPLDITHPTGQDPVWRFSVTVHVSKVDVIWRAGEGDSVVLHSRELFELYQIKLNNLHRKEIGNKSYQTQEGKVVLRKNWSSLMPEDSDDTLTNVAINEEGNWVATQDIAKDSHIVLLLKQCSIN